MSLQLVNANVVVAAHHFNPTITDQIWLDRNDIVRKEEIEGPFAFTDMLVQVQTQNFHLLILPDRCQFTPGIDFQDQQQLIISRVGRLVQELPHTPYRAVGINFVWHLVLSDIRIEQRSRQMFFVENSPLHMAFDADDARFGSYLSKDSMGCRLRLDVKPAVRATGNEKIDLIQYSFNYHCDLSEVKEPADAISRTLAIWNEAKAESFEIARTSEEQHQ